MLVRKIRSRGANIVVEAHGEVLFAPGADISRWKNRFSNRITAFTAQGAPTNKRPRWAHYGKPLKTTFTASTRTRITKGGGFVYIAVGSTAPHAYYVDQGTGVYNGSGPYEAKVLPPWLPIFDLYENTWRPAGPGGRKVKPVMIKGQRGQFFFDKGLKRGFQSMRLRSYQVPGEGVSSMAGALASFPTGMENFLGNTVSDATFKAQLQEWRRWRDERWQSDKSFGPKAEAKPKRKPPSRMPKATKPKPVKPTKPTRPPKSTKAEETLGQKRARAIEKFIDQNPNIQVLREIPAGLVVRTFKGPYVIPWSRILRLVD